MAILDDIPKTYPKAIRALAAWHAEAHDGPITVYSFPDPEEAVVRLVEVSDDFPGTGVVIPMAMGRSDEFPFKSCVALLTPREWDSVESGEIALPDGWELKEKEQVWPQ